MSFLSFFDKIVFLTKRHLFVLPKRWLKKNNF